MKVKISDNLWMDEKEWQKQEEWRFKRQIKFQHNMVDFFNKIHYEANKI